MEEEAVEELKLDFRLGQYMHVTYYNKYLKDE